ncbi:MAG: hypothetical protein VB085_09720 [Peptococcaceae bacterium]|nr:hypothetical protein [Peptococcaceae bacterium]
MHDPETFWLGLTEEECARICREKSIVCTFRRTRDPRQPETAKGVWRVIKSEGKAGEISFLLGLFAPPAMDQT